MKISENYQTYSAPNFGMSVIASRKAFNYMNTVFTPKQAGEINKMCTEQLSKKPHIYLRMGKIENPVTGSEVSFLTATVGDNKYSEGVFSRPYDVIKSAINYAKSKQQ